MLSEVIHKLTEAQFKKENPYSGESTQTLSVTDLISEGPIEGLVRGPRSVSFNDNSVGHSAPAFGGGFSDTAGIKMNFLTAPGNTNMAQVSGTAEFTQANMNEYLGSNAAYVRVKNAGSMQVQRVAGGSDTEVKIQAVTGSFDSTMVSGSTIFTYKPMKIIIENQTIECRITRVISSSLAMLEFGYPDGTRFVPSAWTHNLTSSATTLRFDKILQIQSVHPNSSRTFIFTTVHGLSGVHNVAYLGKDMMGQEDVKGTETMQRGADVQFRPGNLFQAPFQGEGGVGSNASTVQPNIAIERSSDFGGDQAPTIFTASSTSSTGLGLTAAQLPAVDEVRISFKYAAGLYLINADGDDDENYIRYKIEFRSKAPSGAYRAWEVITPFDPSEATSAQTNRVHWAMKKNAISFEETIDVTRQGTFTDFQIKIHRLDRHDGKAYKRPGIETSKKSTNVSGATISSISMIFKEKLYYPYTALAKVDFNSRNFPKPPKRAYHCRGLLVKVPSNYVTREEVGDVNGQALYTRNVTDGTVGTDYQDWDGSFRSELQYTNNPAWIFYDILTNNRYGLGDFIGDADIDKYTLYKIGRYCDELVSDGKGGTEPRYRLNTYIQKNQEAYKVIKDMLSNFACMLYFIDGKVFPVQDSPSAPVAIFSKANVQDGAFQYENTGSKTRINQLQVKFNNPDNGYRLDPVLIEDSENIAETGSVVAKEIIAYGCTSESQAIRQGKWHLWTSLNQVEVASFKTGVAGQYLVPGDIISIQDADKTTKRYAGRISGTPLKNLTKSATYSQSASITNLVDSFTNPDAQLPTVMHGRAILPSSFSNDKECLMEHGGTGTGMFVGIEKDSGDTFFVYRVGDGDTAVQASSTSAIVKKININTIPEFDNKGHDITWEVHPTNGTARLWIDKRLVIDESTTDNSALENNKWTGGGVGSWGRGYDTAAGYGSAGIVAWSGTILTPLSVYKNQTAHYSTTSNIALDSSVVINSASDYTLSVASTKPAAFAQKDMTVNGVSIAKGDVVRQAFVDTNGDGTYTLSDLDSLSAATNAFGTATPTEASLLLDFKDAISLDTREVSTCSGTVSKIAVSQAFDDIPSTEFMWVLNETFGGTEVESGGKHYKVLSVIENGDNTFDITAAEHYNEKYDAVEKDYTVYTVDRLLPRLNDTLDYSVPAPVNAFSYSTRSFQGDEQDEVMIMWTLPESDGATRVNADGSLSSIKITEIYEKYAHTEIEHDIPNYPTPIVVKNRQSYLKLTDVTAGEYNASLRTVDTTGKKSDPVIITVVSEDHRLAGVPMFPLGMPIGGQSDSSLKMNSAGTSVAFTKTDYTFKPPQKTADIYGPNNPSNAQTYSQTLVPANFPVSPDKTNTAFEYFRDEDHYLLFDRSATTDKLKLVRYFSGSIGNMPAVKFWHDAGTGSNGIPSSNWFSARTGNIIEVTDSGKVTGDSNCLFKTEYVVGDTIKIDMGSSGERIAKIIYISTNTVLFMEPFLGTTTSGTGTFDHYGLSVGVNIDEDCIVARIYKDSSGMKMEPLVGFLNTTEADGIEYTSGSSIEIYKPLDINADKSSDALNVTGNHSNPIELTTSNGGLKFNNGGAIKVTGKDSASSATNGFFMGYDTGKSAYTFGIGNDTDFLRWNGSDMEITGKVTAKSGGQVGGWNITATGMYGGDVTSASAEALSSGFVESLCASEGALVLHNQGSIHSKNFFINSDGSAKFRGSISAATGTFFGGLLPNAVSSQEINSGSVGTEQIAAGSVEGQHFSQSTLLAVYETAVGGSVVESSYAALDGQHEKFRIYAGDTSAASAPFRVTKDGQVVASNLQLYDSSDQLYFDSTTGFTPSALAQIAAALSTRIFNFAEIWTGNLDANDNSTFEKITLTESTNVTSKLRIPVNKLSASVSEEYFGLTNKALYANVDVNTATGTSINNGFVLNPDTNAAVGRSLKVGEMVRISLLNVPAGVTLTNVSKAIDGETDAAFASTTTIEGPAESRNIYFKVTETGNFTATINVPGASAISLSIGVAAKPDTLQAAKDKIPSSIAFKLDRNTASANGTTVNVLANQSYSRVFDSTPNATSYNVKTISEDVLSYGFISSSVEIQLGQGAVDSQGYISRSVTESNVASNSYYYNSTLTVTGGASDNTPSNRLFEASVPTTSAGFIISGNVATQASQNTSVDTLDLSGNVTGSDGMTITPGTSSGTVVIDGNLTVNGTQTTTNTDSLQIADKCILVAANAANAAAVTGAGLYVDRSEFGSNNPSITWQDALSSFVVSDIMKATKFHSSSDGSQASPAYIFGNRTSNTGIYAVDHSANNDEVRITTNDSTNVARESKFNHLGIQSHKHLQVGTDGVFRGDGASDWVANSTNSAYDFKFIADSSTRFVVNSASAKAGVFIDAPEAPFHVYAGDSGVTAANSNLQTLFIEKDTAAGITIATPGNATGSVNFADPESVTSGQIFYNHVSDEFGISHTGVTKFVINSDLPIFKDESTVQAGGVTGRNAVARIHNNKNPQGANSYVSSLAFTTKSGSTEASQNIVTIRGAISAGAVNNNTGYGFIDMSVPLNEDSNENNSVDRHLRVATVNEDTVALSFGLPSSSVSGGDLVTFRNSGTAYSNTYLNLQDVSTTVVGQETGVRLCAAKTSTSLYHNKIAAVATAAQSDVQDLIITTTRGSGGNFPAVTVKSAEGYVGIGQADPQTHLQVASTGIKSQTKLVPNQTATEIARFTVTDFRTAKALVSMEDAVNNNHLLAELLIVYENSDQSIHMTEYGVVFSGTSKGVTFTAEHSSGNVIIKATCDSNSATRQFNTALTLMAKTIT